MDSADVFKIIGNTNWIWEKIKQMGKTKYFEKPSSGCDPAQALQKSLFPKQDHDMEGFKAFRHRHQTGSGFFSAKD